MHHNIQMQMKLNFIKSIWVWRVTLMQAYIYISNGQTKWRWLLQCINSKQIRFSHKTVNKQKNINT